MMGTTEFSCLLENREMLESMNTFRESVHENISDGPYSLSDGLDSLLSDSGLSDMFSWTLSNFLKIFKMMA